MVCIALLKLSQNARNFVISPLNLGIINFGNFSLTIVLALTIEGGAGTNPESVPQELEMSHMSPYLLASTP